MREKKIKLPRKVKIPKKGKVHRSFLSHFDWLNRFKHWWLGGASITRSIFRVSAAWQGVGILGTVLGGMYVMSAFYTGAGEFVIRVDNPANDTLALCDTPDFLNPLVVLKGKALPNADNISIFDLPPNVTEPDGPHNGSDYVAYTFYLKNMGVLEADYQYTLTIRSVSQNVDKASWVMVYQNGQQETYASPGADGNPECQFSEFPFPFVKDAREPDRQQKLLGGKDMGYLTNEELKARGLDSPDGIYQMETVPFAADKMIMSGRREGLGADEIDKYTVVVWLEGEDPECVDDILGGHIELLMKFSY